MSVKQRDRRLRVVLALLLLLLGLGVTMLGKPLGPSRTDGTQPQFQVSTLDLTGTRRIAILSGEGMIPGDSVNGALTVANPGRRMVLYSMMPGVVATTDVLAAALEFEIRTVGRSCQDFDGTSLYRGPITAASLGHPPSEPRQLEGATAEILCFRATLPLSAGNEVQGAETTVSFRFDADWTAAAP